MSGVNGYEPGALLMNKTINEMREYVEFQKFMARMLIDNDDTRQFKEDTKQHKNKLYNFIYNNPEIDKFTMRGKYEAIGQSAYVPSTEKKEESTPTSTTTESIIPGGDPFKSTTGVA